MRAAGKLALSTEPLIPAHLAHPRLSIQPETTTMNNSRFLTLPSTLRPTRPSRTWLYGVGIAAALSGCAGMQSGMNSDMKSDANLVALTTQMRAGNEVPPVASGGTGSVDAMYNKNTNQLKWRVTYSGLTGAATAGHFHGPAAVGANAGVVVPWTAPLTSPFEGSATLTAAQAADLLAGRWYANIHTAANPSGELRGQMTVRN
jgi:CHRD domain